MQQLEKNKGLSTSVALVSEILGLLNFAKVARDSIKTTGFKRSINNNLKQTKKILQG